MSGSLPQTMKALVAQEGKTVGVQDIPLPTPDETEVLIRVHSIAQNPTDWKHADNISKPGNLMGCDFAGTVVKLGSDTITSVKVGDTVAGFVHGGKSPARSVVSYLILLLPFIGMYTDRGAFAQYTKAQADLVWKFSPSSVSFDEAATMGCALWTAVQAFYNRMGLAEPSTPSTKGEWILIHGGSTSLGLFSTQLAKLSGYKVVATVSPKNSELLKSLGADATVDYRASDVVEQIQNATGNTLKFAFDTISEGESQFICVKSLAPASEGAPGKVVVVLAPNKEAIALRNDVVIQHTLIYTVFGRSFGYHPKAQFPASAEDHNHMAAWMPKLTELVNSGKVKPNPVKLWSGGLEAVKDGFQYMREGKVSAAKIVYNVE
ncbi:hypothetical protein FRC07_010339 [Ceratobasidium sp. 392]|nr:hypothetical protein FRC07_010339 [Ceratobasidium sp. 392]